MKESPLVSILMTAYNREKYIGEAIESVLASTYRNLELIIVDDRSTDSTLEISRRYAAADSRVKVYLNEKNLGDYPNRNKAASYAQGKYIKYIDADDTIYYWGLQVIVEMMERFPEAGYGLDSIQQDDEKMFPYVLNPKEAYEAYYIKRMGLFDKAPTSCIIRREVFEKEGRFKPLRMVGDCELWHRLSLNYSMVVMPHGIVWSRGHADSESGKLFPDPFIIYHYLLVSRQFLTRENCPLDHSVRTKKASDVAWIQTKILVKLFLRLNFEKIRQIKKIDPAGVMGLLKIKNQR